MHSRITKGDLVYFSLNGVKNVLCEVLDVLSPNSLLECLKEVKLQSLESEEQLITYEGMVVPLTEQQKQIYQLEQKLPELKGIF